MDEVNVCLAGMLIGAVGTWLCPPQCGKFTIGDAFAIICMVSLGHLALLAWQGGLA